MGERIRAASDDVNSQHNRLLRIHITLQYAPNIYPESRYYGNSVWRSQADCSHSRVSSHQKEDVISHSETNLKKQQQQKKETNKPPHSPPPKKKTPKKPKTLGTRRDKKDQVLLIGS